MKAKQFYAIILSILMLLAMPVCVSAEVANNTDEGSISEEVYVLVSEDGSDLSDKANKLLSADDALRFVLVVNSDNALINAYQQSDAGELIQLRMLENENDTDNPQDNELEAGTTFEVGVPITTTNFEFTLNSFEFVEEIYPPDLSGYYSYIPDIEGKVFLFVSIDVKNLGKKSIDTDEIYSATAYYDDGYEFSGYEIVFDDQGDLAYANITSLDPLSTLHVGYAFELPDDVAASEAPLYVDFNFEGDVYPLTIR